MKMKLLVGIVAAWACVGQLTGGAAVRAHAASIFASRFFWEADEEDGLLAILGSDAAEAEKAIACKKLAIVGSSRAVSPLAKLLPNPRLNSWALIALEAIPGDEASAALRDAVGQLSGLPLVGVINSIGVRRDAAALEILSTQIEAADPEVAAAAAVALGRIGNLASAVILRKSLQSADQARRDAAAEACILCAENLLVSGHEPTASELYDDVRRANVKAQRILEATRGAILTRGSEGLPLLLETLRSSDNRTFQLGLQTIREFPAGELESVLVNEWQKQEPQRAALLVQALSERSGDQVQAKLMQAASAGDLRVRLSAVESLGRVGGVGCVELLLKLSSGGPEEVSTASLTALAQMSGQGVDAALVQRLQQAKSQEQADLLKLIGLRQIQAFAEIEAAMKHSDLTIRKAAIYAAGETVTSDRLPWLIRAAVASENKPVQSELQQALTQASVRMPDPDNTSRQIDEVLKTTDSNTASSLLEILANVGGAKALEILGAAAKSNDSQLQDTATRLLGTWNSIAAAPVLMDLAQNLEQEKFRVRAIRGYTGLIRKFDMPESERVAMCAAALKVASRPADQQLVVEVMKRYPSAAMLELAAVADKISGLENTSAEIRQRLEGKKK